MPMSLNSRALGIVEALLAQADESRVDLHEIEGGGRFVDCGIEARGGLLAGIDLARMCLGGLADRGDPIGRNRMAGRSP